MKFWGKNIKEEGTARVNTPGRNEFVKLEVARKLLWLEQSDWVRWSLGRRYAGGRVSSQRV